MRTLLADLTQLGYKMFLYNWQTMPWLHKAHPPPIPSLTTLTLVGESHQEVVALFQLVEELHLVAETYLCITNITITWLYCKVVFLFIRNLTIEHMLDLVFFYQIVINARFALTSTDMILMNIQKKPIISLYSYQQYVLMILASTIFNLLTVP